MKNTHLRPNNCLAGKILRVDLSSGLIKTEPTEPYVLIGLGGRGINSLIMLKEIPIGTKWDDPENLLCFGVGSLVGTMVPGACRVDVASINVFSGGKGSSNVGGFWGSELKYAGFDNIIISGVSKKPVYLWINNGTAELRDASFAWGKSVNESEKMLREAHGNDPFIEIAQIGPSGENLVRGSAVMIDTAKAAGGSGVGCVMGTKKLKAIVVRGTESIKVSNPEDFMKEVEKAFKQCADEPTAPVMRKSLTNYYADPDFEGWDNIMVVRNGQDEWWPKEKKLELMNPETGAPSHRAGMRACYNCPTGCMSFMKMKKGPNKGYTGEGFWVNTIMGHACRLDNSEPDSVIYSWLKNNDLGMDSDYAASTCAWAFELYDKGIITKEDTDGLELVWGCGEAFIELMTRIAYRKGKFANMLADGAIEAAKKIGNNAIYYLSHMNGQPSIEPFRACRGWGLAVATSPVAGRHLRGSSIGTNRFGPRPRPTSMPVDPQKFEDQPKICYWQGRSKELEDNFGICNYAGTWSGANYQTIENFASYANSALGLDVTPEELMEYYAPIGRNLEKAFNTLHTDMDRKDDMPPLRFQQEGIKSGPHAGMKAETDGYNKMLDMFYELWDWDVETGLQTRTCLEKLGLHEVADKLASVGKLIEK